MRCLTDNLRITVQPTAEPVTLARAKLHLRLISDEGVVVPLPEDGLIGDLITAARQMAEEYLNRPVAKATYEMRRAGFSTVVLPFSPVQSIASVKYISSTGAVETLDVDDYELAGSQREPVLRLAYGKSWPTSDLVRQRDDSVRISFVAGYDDIAGIDPLPRPIMSAMLLTIGHLYENRESVLAGTTASELPLGALHLLDPYRLGMGL